MAQLEASGQLVIALRIPRKVTFVPYIREASFLSQMSLKKSRKEMETSGSSLLCFAFALLLSG